MKRSALALLLCLSVTACGSDEPAKSAAGSADPKAEKKKGRKGAAAAAAEVPEGEEKVAAPGPPKVDFQEADFSETDRSRDPFRSFTDVFEEQAKSKVRAQVHVVAKNYSVGDLKLVGIVTRIHPARAMFVDPSGKGHVVDHGDFVGRPEIVQGGTTSTDYEIHWRVDRVRDSDVVMIREDPANPDIPSATRVFQMSVDEPTTQ